MREIIENLVKEFVENYKENFNFGGFWKEPVIGFANAKDPLFFDIKEKVNKKHKLPFELLNQAKTVICYFIPFSNKVILSNSRGKKASLEWAIAYIETNKLLIKLNDFLAKELKKEGFDSVKIMPTHNFDKKTLLSYWSHKHIAYIAGLGKFGLHKMIITEKGCCGRLGSLITSAKIKATKRTNKEYCLYFYNKSCKKCIDNCFYNILTVNSFDRHKCYSICLKNAQIFSHLGLADICGKCTCGVPCSHKNPVSQIID